jgi:alpha-galactosidase
MKPNPRTGLALIFLAAFSALHAAAQVIPVDLPPADAKPAATDKPVKIYIQSGQSNSLGFGAVKPGAPQYAKIFLSADPTAQNVALPVASSALLKFGVHDATASVFAGAYDAKADLLKMLPAKKGSVALGDTSATLPSIDGPHHVVVDAFIDVPFDGNYELHAGFESSAQAIAKLDGREAYRKDGEGAATVTKVALKKGLRTPLRITYLKGGSAALWLEQVDLRAFGDLGHVVDELGRFRYLRAEDGSWVKRPDVFLNDAYMGKGSSAPHGVDACGPTFGPELGFGFVMGTFHDEPVIVMKADIGNRSLGWDVLPPGSERYTFEGTEYPGYGETMDADGTIRKPKEGEWYAGKQYDDYTASIRAVLDNFGERYPQFKDQGYEVAGFAWWQGHKDSGSAAHTARYEENLANLIKAWRKEFNAPKAHFVVGTGCGSQGTEGNALLIAQAQLNVSDPKRHPELAGTVKTVDTRPFWRDSSISPKNQGYHYNHNAETYMLVGDALGRAMVGLKGDKAEYPEPGMVKAVDAPPYMQPSTASEVKPMIPAIKPIIMDGLLPEFALSAANVPSYLRRGLPLENILSGEKPAKPSPIIESQLDQMISFYELVGIDEFNWKPFGPEMKAAEWSFLTFDPAEKKTGPEGDRYRPVTLPAGSENWFAADFDAAKAGWKTAKAPFGQNDGKLEALIPSCDVPHCGCNVTPATLWDKEVLLMRQTFEVPKLDSDHRYRIVVGGAGHGWSGEGYALYLNGKLVSEATGGYYKSGGQTRGALILNDLMPEFESGKVTIAVKSFLRRNGHRGKAAPPTGHMSVWLESAKLSPVAVEMIVTK